MHTSRDDQFIRSVICFKLYSLRVILQICTCKMSVFQVWRQSRYSLNLWSVESKGTKQQIGVHTLYSHSFRVDGSHCHDDEQWLFSWIKVVGSFDRFVRCLAFVPGHHTDYSGWLIAFVSVDMLCVIVFNDTYLVEMCRYTHTYLRRLLSLSIHVPEG